MQVVGRIEDWESEYPELVAITRTDGLTELALVSVPLMSGTSRIGFMLARRSVARPFDASHIALLQHLAAQAVIAVENARAFNELQASNRAVAEALEQQTATAEVLEVISKAPSDLQTALYEVALKAARISASERVVILRVTRERSEGLAAVVDGIVWPEGGTLTAPAVAPPQRGSESVQAALREGRTVMRHGGPAAVESLSPDLAARWRELGVNSAVATPLITSSGPFGVLVVSRRSVEPYTPSQVALLETFAAQAVIAIENARLFNQLEQRNRDVTEALDQQTAMAEILEVISKSPTDVSPVLDAITEASLRLFDVSSTAGVWRPVEGMLEAWSLRGIDQAALPAGYRMPADAVGAGEAYTQRRTVNLRVSELDTDRRARYAALVDLAPGGRLTLPGAILATPMLRGNEVLGVLSIARMFDGPFTERQAQLLEAFAAQAVIAIENARLFNELQARNKEITEALRREEAGSEILRQISRAPEELDTTLTAISTAARELCNTDGANVWLIEGDEAVGGNYSARVDALFATTASIPSRFRLTTQAATLTRVRSVKDELSSSMTCSRCSRRAASPTPWHIAYTCAR